MKKIINIIILLLISNIGFSQLEKSKLQIDKINQDIVTPRFVFESKFCKVKMFEYKGALYAIDCSDNAATPFYFNYAMIKYKDQSIVEIDGKLTFEKMYATHWHILPADDGDYVYIITQNNGLALSLGEQVDDYYEIILSKLNKRNNDDQKWKLVRVK